MLDSQKKTKKLQQWKRAQKMSQMPGHWSISGNLNTFNQVLLNRGKSVMPVFPPRGHFTSVHFHASDIFHKEKKTMNHKVSYLSGNSWYCKCKCN